MRPSMKRHCRSVIFTLAGAFLSASIRGLLAQPHPVVPPPATLSVAAAVPQESLDQYLKFDADEKTVTVTNGTAEGHFTFTVTNFSDEDVIINYIVGSCHCTVAEMPTTPWKLSPKQGGEFSAHMDLAGTPPNSSKFKTLTVGADKGIKVLNVTTRVLPDAASMTAEDRTNAVKMATADRQAVFKGDCFQCHGAPAKDAAGNDKYGHDLYAAVCGVCHEATHRATFVPDLHHLAEPTSAEFWRNWITGGKPGTLMPAFAKSEGGVLSGEQIDSLIHYLSDTIPAKPIVVPAPRAAK
jgi:mono/diheme cytochrome c family protein